MTKTGKEIESDVFSLLQSSLIVTGKGEKGTPGRIEGINGGSYRPDQRPRDSKLEDMVVIFTTGTSTQFQRGVVTLNIYVPDIYPYGDGIPHENGARCEEIERLAQDTVDALVASLSDYLFSIERSRCIHTQRDEEIHQSFVVVPLFFKFIH